MALPVILCAALALAGPGPSLAARFSGVSELVANASAGYPELCAPALVAETCAMLDEQGSSSADLLKVMAATSASRASVVGLWKELKIKKQHVPCQEFCEELIGLLKGHKYHLPPSSDLGCFEAEDGTTQCTLDLSPGALGEMTPPGEELPDFNAGEPAGPEGQGAGEVDEEKLIDYTVEELAVRVANLFRIYPEVKFEMLRTAGGAAPSSSSSALLEGNVSRGRHSWFFSSNKPGEEKLQVTHEKAEAYLSEASRCMLSGACEALVQKWFGPVEEEDRKEVLRVLNSADRIIHSMEYVYVGRDCDGYRSAYQHSVKGSARDGCKVEELGDDLNRCRTTTDGKFLVYLCPRLFDEKELIQIELLTHQAVMHAGAYQVTHQGEDIYGRKKCERLAAILPYKAVQNADNYKFFIQDATNLKK